MKCNKTFVEIPLSFDLLCDPWGTFMSNMIILKTSRSNYNSVNTAKPTAEICSAVWSWLLVLFTPLSDTCVHIHRQEITTTMVVSFPIYLLCGCSGGEVPVWTWTLVGNGGQWSFQQVENSFACPLTKRQWGWDWRWNPLIPWKTSPTGEHTK